MYTQHLLPYFPHSGGIWRYMRYKINIRHFYYTDRTINFNKWHLYVNKIQINESVTRHIFI